jgi:cell division protein FtsI (penicillin-binding protein 3)
MAQPSDTQQSEESAGLAGRVFRVHRAGTPGHMRAGPTVAALLALAVGLVGMSARVFWLASGHAKGPNGTDLCDLYKRQHTATIPLSARRGDIYDCRGRRLAGSIDVPSVFADPALIDDIDTTAAKLQETLNVPAAEIATVLAARKDKRFAWVQRRVTEEQAEKVKAQRLAGIGILREPFRNYPNGPLAAHVLGFVGADQQGLAGVELQYDEKLRGTDGRKICTKDAAGRILSLVPNGYQPAHDGCNLILTIDSFIQSVAERYLQEAVDQYQAQAGVAIVCEPGTGQILALACRPTFDPNRYRNAAESALRNRALVGPVEPGSIFKPLVMSAAVQEGYVRPGEIFYCHDGVYVSGSRRLRDHHPYGNLTIEQIISKSSNIGMALIGERLGNPLMWHYLTQYGLGAKTGIDLPGEDVGILLPLKKWTRFSTNSIPMGQEVSVTPIQILSAFNAIVNGGTLVQPTVTRAITAPDGSVIVDRREPKVVRKVIEPAVADYMTNVMLKAVVNEGTGTKARLARWQAVGKTGTGQIARHGGGGYEPDAYVGSFICAAPADDPKVSVAVMIFRPNKRIGYYGGTVACPAAGKILGAALDYLNVPDDAVPPPLDARMLAAAAGSRD